MNELEKLQKDPIGTAVELMELLREGGHSRRDTNGVVYLLTICRQLMSMIRDGEFPNCMPNAEQSITLAGIIAETGDWMPDNYDYENMRMCNKCLILRHKENIDGMCECGEK